MKILRTISEAEARKFNKWWAATEPLLSKPGGLALFVRELVLKGYEQEYRVHFDQAGSFYVVDFAFLKASHIVEIEGKHHLSKTFRARSASRDATLRKLGWSVRRITYEELQGLRSV